MPWDALLLGGLVGFGVGLFAAYADVWYRLIPKLDNRVRTIQRLRKL